MVNYFNYIIFHYQNLITLLGLIFATGESDGCLRIWDITSQENITTFEAHTNDVASISFSENGYYLATCGLKNPDVKIWDLRKPDLFKTITLNKEDLHSVEFDYSGNYLGVVGNKTHLYDTKTWTQFASFNDHKDVITDIKFGKNSNYFITTSMDRTMKIYSH